MFTTSVGDQDFDDDSEDDDDDGGDNDDVAAGAAAIANDGDVCSSCNQLYAAMFLVFCL